MLSLPDAWTWDFWLADTGTEFHAFYLKASRGLKDPDRRHRRAGIGHAVSTDLTSWTVLPDALVHADPPAFDDMATWTGSVLRAPDGNWRIFYTGLTHRDDGRIQRIGIAESRDLIHWDPVNHVPILEADPRWYEKYDGRQWPEEAWRDPWVFPDPDDHGWHMLITARANSGPTFDRGVVGHAYSDDLDKWKVLPPLSSPNAGFGQLEVMQVEKVDGRHVLLFSCLSDELSVGRRHRGERGGTWSLTTDSMLGPFDLNHSHPLTGPEFYSGRIIQDRTGQWVLLAFHNTEADEPFGGYLSDPMPVHWASNNQGQPVLARQDS
jgi:beta-fructofuranosidase